GAFAERPELLAQVIPQYPPFAKRILLDNGIWARTITRPNVTLVTDGISSITDTAVVAGGTPYEVDAIIYATGFEAARFLVPMKVIGCGGVDLHEHWDGD